jgi:large subunit ribosomal protein L3
MPGHLGDERVTVQNLQVMQVRETEKVILISGAVPGANGSYVVIRPAIKKPAAAPAKPEAAKKPEPAKKPEATTKPEAAKKSDATTEAEAAKK